MAGTESWRAPHYRRHWSLSDSLLRSRQQVARDRYTRDTFADFQPALNNTAIFLSSRRCCHLIQRWNALSPSCNCINYIFAIRVSSRYIQAYKEVFTSAELYRFCHPFCPRGAEAAAWDTAHSYWDFIIHSVRVVNSNYSRPTHSNLTPSVYI